MVKKIRKLAILVQIFEILDFDKDFLDVSILVKIFENLDFGQNFRKMAIKSKFAKISSLVIIFEKPRFYSKHLDFGPNFRQSRFWSKLSKYLDFGQSLEK